MNLAHRPWNTVVLLVCLSCAACTVSGTPSVVPTVAPPTSLPSPAQATATIAAVTPTSPISANLSFEQAMHQFDYDASIPLDVKVISTKDVNGVTIQSITYTAHSPQYGIKGRTLAYLVKPGGKGPTAGILFMHWLGQPRGNRDEFLDGAVQLAQQGTVSLLVQGTFPWNEAPANGERDRDQVIQQVIELRRALDFLLSQPEVDATRIGYVGHDYGALYGGILAGVEKRIKTFVLMTGMGTFSDWSLKYFPATNANGADPYRQALQAVDPIQYVGHAAPSSLLFQFARDDRFISQDAAQEFSNAASEPKQVQFYDAPHSLDNDNARRERKG